MWILVSDGCGALHEQSASCSASATAQRDRPVTAKLDIGAASKQGQLSSFNKLARDILLHDHPSEKVAQGVVLIQDAVGGCRVALGKAGQLFFGSSSVGRSASCRRGALAHRCDLVCLDRERVLVHRRSFVVGGHCVLKRREDRAQQRPAPKTRPSLFPSRAFVSPSSALFPGLLLRRGWRPADRMSGLSNAQHSTPPFVRSTTRGIRTTHSRPFTL